MADLPKPAEIATSAVAHVVSKIIPDRLYSYLAAFMPGLFFEISLLVGSPALVSERRDQLEQSFSLGRPLTIGIALFLAFIIGNAFMLIPPLIQNLIFQPLYRVRWVLWRQFCIWPLKPTVEWLLKKPKLMARFHREIVNLHKYVLDLGFTTHPDEAQSTWSCWVTVAAQLLTERYGLKLQDLRHDHQWGVLYWILGKWEPEDSRGSLLLIATEATGWAGLVAIRLAPALRSRPYFYFVLALIVFGLLHDWYVAGRAVDPRFAGYSHVRAVMRELRQLPGKRETAKPEAGEDEVI